MGALAGLGQNILTPLGGTASTAQNSALTPQSLVMGSVPSSIQTASAIGNPSLSPLALLLSSFGVGK